MIITGGKYKGMRVFAPDKRIARPTLSKVRMGVFNTLFSIIQNYEEKTFLDLFGGSGIMGLEALSRGFGNVLVFEKNPKAVQIIKNNYERLELKADIRVGDSLKFLQNSDQNFDIIYVDPPYKSGIYEEVFPFFKSGSIIIAEHSQALSPEGFLLIKSKNYGGKFVSFYQKEE